MRARVVVIRGPWSWTWRVDHDDGSFTESVELDPGNAMHQALLDRDQVLAGEDPARLRDALRDVLRDVLGSQLATALADPKLSAFIVEALPAAHTALTLPYELLTESGGSVPVLRLVSAWSPSPKAPHPQRERRLVLASALVETDPYLPLHREAEAVARIAGDVGFALNELFLSFCDEEFLTAGRRAAIVHVACHGDRHGLRIVSRDSRTPQLLRAGSMIDAWRDSPPGLIVLNACRSADDQDAGEAFSVLSYTSLAHIETFSDLSDGGAGHVVSIALRLAAALPVAVLAMRTPVDDTDARRFIERFYGKHLHEGNDVVAAFASAVEGSGFVDSLGAPIPRLFLSRQWWDAGGHLPMAQVADARPTLDAVERRTINLLYKAFAPLGRSDRQDIAIYLAGRDSLQRDRVVAGAAHLLQDLADSAGDTDCGTNRSQRVEVAEMGSTACIARITSGTTSTTSLIGIELDGLPEEVVLTELAPYRAYLTRRRFDLLVRASCLAPSLVTGLPGSAIEKLGETLEQVAGSRDDFDAGLGWDLVTSYLHALNPEERDSVERWSEAKWAALQGLGSRAIDICAVRCVLGSAHWTVDKVLEGLSHYCADTGLTLKDVWSHLRELAEAGVASLGPDVLTGTPTTLSFDLLTATRAWAHASPAARNAHMRSGLERQIWELNYRELWPEVPVHRLRYLAETALKCHSHVFGHLVDRLADVDDPEHVNMLRRLGEESGLYVGGQSDRSLAEAWLQFDRALMTNDFGTALHLLEDIARRPDSHELQVAIYRLAYFSDANDPSDQLSHALELEEQVLEVLRSTDDDEQEVSRLVLLGQVIQRALGSMGRLDEAADQSISRYRSLVGRASVQACALAGAVALNSLLRTTRVADAKQLADELRELTHDLPIAGPRLFAAAQVVRADVVAGFDARARAGASALLGELADWREPRLDIASEVVSACGQVALFAGDPVAAIALASANAWLDPRSPLRVADTANVVSGSVADVARKTSDADVVEAATALAQRLARVLSLGDGPECDFVAWAVDYRQRVAQMPGVEPLTALLGYELDIDGLRRRAEAGCPLANLFCDTATGHGIRLVFDGLPPAPEPLSEAPAGIDVPDIDELFGRSVPEQISVAIPLLAAAHHGDTAARVLYFGLLHGDLARGGDSSLSPVLVAVAAGRSWSVIETTLRQLPVGHLAAAAAIIDACWRHDENTQPLCGEAGTRLSHLSESCWKSTAAQAAFHDETAAVLLTALKHALGPAVCELFRLAVDTHAGKPPSASFPSTVWLKQLVRSEGGLDERLAAAALRDPDLAGLAETSLRRAMKTGPPTRAARALRILVADDSAEGLDEERLSADLQELAALGRTLEPGSGEQGACWSAVSNGARRVADWELLAEATRRIEMIAEETKDERMLLRVLFNKFQVSVAMQTPIEALAALSRSVDRFGFSATCWIAGAGVENWIGDPELRDSVFGLLSKSARVAEGHGHRGGVKQAAERLLATLPTPGRWGELRSALAATLDHDEG